MRMRTDHAAAGVLGFGLQHLGWIACWSWLRALVQVVHSRGLCWGSLACDKAPESCTPFIHTLCWVHHAQLLGCRHAVVVVDWLTCVVGACRCAGWSAGILIMRKRVVGMVHQCLFQQFFATPFPPLPHEQGVLGMKAVAHWPNMLRLLGCLLGTYHLVPSRAY